MGRQLPPFVVHVAGKPDGWLQRCVACGFVLTDNTAWGDRGVATRTGDEQHGLSWWPDSALVATDKEPGSCKASMTYTVEPGRVLDDDERSCVMP
jgi:hypothetical protein